MRISRPCKTSRSRNIQLISLQKTMSTEVALRRYCAQSVVDEYDKLSIEAKTRMLDAMITSVKGALFRMPSAEENSRKPLKKVANKSETKSCPLFRALVEAGVTINLLKENVMDQLRSFVKRWGNDEVTFGPMEKLFRYQMMVSAQKESLKNETDDKSFYYCSRTDSTVVKSGGTVVDWQSLRPIKIGGLKLFDTCWGCSLEGTIVGEAIVPIISGTVLIQDIEGDYLRVSFYNFLPEGIRGKQAEPLLAEMFPMGHSLRIKEPFTKIFADGFRGVRVDDCSEIHVNTTLSNSQRDSTVSFLVEQKAKGNEFFKEKNYSAAYDVYINTLKRTELIPTLLSNRCQAFVNLEQWHDGLLDAAASLTIRPNSTKTWERYNLCLTKVKELNSCEKNYRDMFKDLLPHLTRSQSNEEMNRNPDDEKGDSLKEKGNDAFRKKRFTDAAHFYSKALLEAGSVVQTLLNNWAQCAIELDSLNDIVAATCAALRICFDEKSVYRLCKGLCFLGEYEIAVKILDLLPNKSSSLKHLEKDVKKIMAAFSSDLKVVYNVRDLIYDMPPLHSRWIGEVETFMTMDKGRGLRACTDLEIGSLILVDRAIAKAECDKHFFAINLQKNSYDAPSTTKLKSDLAHRCHIDGVLSDIISNLTDGENTKQLVPLKSFMRTLESCKFLLPGLFSYSEDSISTLTTETIHNIVSMNVHGSNPHKADNPVVKEKIPEKHTIDSTSLFALVSAINHSNNPNCISMHTVESCAMVIATKRISKGSEICVSYLPDEKVVAEKWKFKNNSSPLQPPKRKNKKK